MWQPEMELIDQLEGGPMPIGMLRHVFSDHDRARRVLAMYVSRGVIVLTRDQSPLPSWEANQLLRDEKNLFTRDDLCLTLAHKGAQAFEQGRWEHIS